VKLSDRRCGTLRCVGLVGGSVLNERSEAPRVIYVARIDVSPDAELPMLSAIPLGVE